MNSARTFASRHARNLVALAATLWSLECAAQFGNPRFSPDEEYLAFDYCTPKCLFVVHSLRTGATITFDAPKGETWINPSFGPKPEQVVFVVIREPSNTQISTIALDGTGYRELTSSAVVKRSPSVSPDGKLVVFAGGSKTVTERGSFSRVDLYVTDVQTREERRVTDLRVIDIGSPLFLPDGQKITFGTVGSAIPRSAPTIYLEKLYPNRKVFVQSLNESANLEPVLDVPLVASKPMPIASGEIAVLVRVNEIDQLKGSYVYDVFLAKHGKATRHTTFRSYVWSYGISSAGELVAYVADVPGKGAPIPSWMWWRKATPERETRLMLWRKTTGKAVELKIPPAKRISLKNP